MKSYDNMRAQPLMCAHLKSNEEWLSGAFYIRYIAKGVKTTYIVDAEMLLCFNFWITYLLMDDMELGEIA